MRIRPENSNGKEGDWRIKKVSSDALCVGDRQFKFDKVFDTNSNQVVKNFASLSNFAFVFWICSGFYMM